MSVVGSCRQELSSSIVGRVMDESNCLRDLLSQSVIMKEHCDKLQAQKVEASDPKTGEGVWLEVAKIIREDAQNFQKLRDVLERYKATMSSVLSMLEKHFGKTALITSNKKNLSVCHQ